MNEFDVIPEPRHNHPGLRQPCCRFKLGQFCCRGDSAENAGYRPPFALATDTSLAQHYHS